MAACASCKGPTIEIDHYGERLVGCIEYNKWSWPDSERLFIELSNDDKALREKSARDLEERAGEALPEFSSARLGSGQCQGARVRLDRCFPSLSVSTVGVAPGA
jgi:hypothetical protein